MSTNTNTELNTALGRYLSEKLGIYLKGNPPVIVARHGGDHSYADRLTVGDIEITIRLTSVISTVDIALKNKVLLKSLPVINERDWHRELDPEGDMFTYAQVCHLVSVIELQSRNT